MKYQLRPGVTRVSVCGVMLLVPTRQAYPACSTIFKLPLFWAMIWDLIEKGKSPEDAAKIFSILNKKPEAENLERIHTICETLAEKGYLIRSSDDDAESAESAS